MKFDVSIFAFVYCLSLMGFTKGLILPILLCIQLLLSVFKLGLIIVDINKFYLVNRTADTLAS